MSQILIIDDDPVLQRILQRTLEEQGYRVTLTNDGIEGIQQAQILKPAVVICDWMMPGMDGLEVCRQLKAYPELSTTFFLLLTARGNIADRVQGLETGADDFLTKPVDLAELKARVRAAMRLYQLNHDLKQQKQLLEDELAEAVDYMRSLLPQPMSDPVKIDARFVPSRQLGGDAFDYYWLDPDYLLIYLLDVSGHGLGAALPSISVLNLLRSQMLPGVNFYRPENILETLNDTFQMSSHNEKYFTIWLGLYNQRKRTLVYASAGHPPAVLITPDPETGTVTVQRLKTAGLPIGMLPEVTFDCARCEIPSGSFLYVFSDGAYELMNATTQTFWSLDEFVELLGDQPHASLEQLMQAIQSRSGTTLFNDDLSMLKVQFG